MNLNAHLLLVCVGGIADCIGLDVAIFERDAIGNLLHVGGREVLVKMNMVNLLLQELGVSEFGCQVAVVGEEKHTCGVAVKTTNGIDALAAAVLH